MPVGLLTFWVGLVLAIGVHEAGHAVIGQWLGLSPRTICIGVGPTLFKWRWRQAWVQCRLLPLTGYVSVPSLPSNRGGAVSLFILGGVIGNAVCFMVLGAFSALRLLPEEVLKPLGMAQAYAIFINLLPLRGRWLGIPVPTDGLQLFRLIRRRVADVVRR